MANANETKLNTQYWPGPNAAGMGKATIPDDTGTAGTENTGMQDTIFIGRNAAGVTRNSVGPNVAGAPKRP